MALVVQRVWELHAEKCDGCKSDQIAENLWADVYYVVSFWRRARAAFKYKNQCLEISVFISDLSPAHLIYFHKYEYEICVWGW